jgi:Peptidase A4 family
MPDFKLIPTNLPGVHVIAPPPVGFNPLTADNELLVQHGLPMRPNPKSDPKAARIFNRVFSSPMKFIVPELREHPEMNLGRRPAAESGKASNTSGVWSGGVLFKSATDTPFKWTSGTWTVPSVTPGGSGDGNWYSVAWVGLDGWDSPDVLQAGTFQHVSVNSGQLTTEYYAWYEWFPNFWTEITNLPVNPGDTISVSVQYLGTTNGIGQGSASLSNLTHGTSVNIHLTAPSGTTLQGNCAEWVMERPGINGQTAALPRYGHVTFTDCLACTNNKTYDGSTATPTNMVNSSNQDLSDGTNQADWSCAYLRS